MKIVMTGATGLIGKPLGERLLKMGYDLTILSRNTRAAAQRYPQSELIPWDAISEPPPSRFLEGAEAVIHLAGESVAGGRWNKQRKEAMRDSRIVGTRNLAESIRCCSNKPKALLTSSAIGIYGNRGDEELNEESSPGKGFLAEVGVRWEAEAEPASKAGARVVILRTGIVLSSQGGALKKMLTPFKMMLGGPAGNGRQWMSWIHLEDQVEAVLFALAQEGISGPVNLTSPNPVTNKQFARALGRALGRPALFPTPRLVLKAVLGEMAEELLLSSQRVRPQRLQENGFQFRFPQLQEALGDLLDRG